jgi:hypothetical protein
MRIIKMVTEFGRSVGYTVTVCVFHGDADYYQNYDSIEITYFDGASNYIVELVAD